MKVDLRAVAVAATLCALGTAAFAQAPTPPANPSNPQPPGAMAMPDPSAPSYDYVQQAASMTFDGSRMTLTGLAPATIFFSDRPYRLAGHVDNETFISLWNEGGSFAQDPPNAAVSALGSTDSTPAIVELTSASVDGGALTYDVTIVAGTLPDSAADVAVFIDRGGGFGGGGFHAGGFHGPNGGGAWHAGGWHGGAGYAGHPPGWHGGGVYHPYGPYHPYHPYGPYPYHPYGPYHPYYPGWPVAAGVAAGAVAGAAIGAAAADSSNPGYVYAVPAGPLPANCHLNAAHSRMICSVPVN